MQNNAGMMQGPAMVQGGAAKPRGDGLRSVAEQTCKHLSETQEMVRQVAGALGVILPEQPGAIVTPGTAGFQQAGGPDIEGSALNLVLANRSFAIAINERLRAILEVL